MNEEIITEEVSAEEAEISEGEGIAAPDEGSDISREEELENALAAARSENEYLKAKCICAEIA